MWKVLLTSIQAWVNENGVKSLESHGQSFPERNLTWEICAGVRTAIHSMLRRGDTILEFGSGYGTVDLGDDYIVHSVEDDKKWLHLDPRATYIHAPIVPIDKIPGHSHDQWYDRDAVSSSLPQKYDLILVDGPSGTIGRSGLLTIIDLLDPDVPWLVDDTVRTEESKIATDIGLALGMKEYRFWNFCILSRSPIPDSSIRRISIASEHVKQIERIHIALENSQFYNSRVEQ